VVSYKVDASWGIQDLSCYCKGNSRPLKELLMLCEVMVVCFRKLVLLQSFGIIYPDYIVIC
jgi:hypothetical protein